MQSGDFLLTNSSLIWVHFPPRFVDGHEDVKLKVTHGDDFTLNCETTENPKGFINWYFTADGLDAKRNFRSSASVLTIERMDETKQGKYECFIENTIGRVRRSFEVADYPKRNCYLALPINPSNHFESFTGPPKILMDKDVIIVNETDPIDLICESFNSLPIKNFSWFNENSNHYERLVIKDEKNDVFKSILRINEIDESDNGSFECYLANEAGEDKITFELLVQTLPKIDAIVMKANDIEKDVDKEVNVLENNEATLECITDGFPTPDVRWFKDQEELKLGGNESVFRINKIRENDAGIYQCIATNILGSVTKIISLKVHVPPKTDSLEEITRKILDNTILSLSCEIKGNPSPQTAWNINGKSTNGMDRIHVSDRKVLTLQNVHITDSGIYSCTGFNEYGNVSIKYNVEVISKYLGNKQIGFH